VAGPPHAAWLLAAQMRIEDARLSRRARFQCSVVVVAQIGVETSPL